MTSVALAAALADLYKVVPALWGWYTGGGHFVALFMNDFCSLSCITGKLIYGWPCTVGLV